MQLHFSQHGSRREAEHARVPQVIAGFHIFAGRFKAGLFDKTHHLVAIRLDIAIACFGGHRFDAKGDQFALCGQAYCLGDRQRKSGLVGDQVICGQHQQDRIVTMAGSHVQCSRGNRRSGVPAKRFEDEAVGKICIPGARDFAVLVLGLEDQFTVGDGQGFGHAGKNCTAQPGLLQQTLTVCQADERFWVQFPGDRPEP